jgi:hypothetical protein
LFGDRHHWVSFEKQSAFWCCNKCLSRSRHGHKSWYGFEGFSLCYHWGVRCPLMA